MLYFTFMSRTFTTTSVPSHREAPCTWATDPQAKGVDSKLRYSEASGAPRSASTTRCTSLKGTWWNIIFEMTGQCTHTCVDTKLKQIKANLPCFEAVLLICTTVIHTVKKEGRKGGSWVYANTQTNTNIIPSKTCRGTLEILRRIRRETPREKTLTIVRASRTPKAHAH